MGANNNKISKRRSEVLSEKLKDPAATEREIAKKLKIDKSMAHRDITSLRQDKAIQENVKIVKIKNKDIEIVETAQEAILSWIKKLNGQKSCPTSRDIDTAITAADKSQKRYSFLNGANSDEKGGEERRIVVIDNDTAILVGELGIKK